MRITKRIEEYIHKQVSDKAYSSPRFKTLKEAADVERQKFYDEWRKICDQAKKEYQQLLEKMNVENPEHYQMSCSGSWSVEDHMPATQAFRAEIRAIDAKVKDTVQDIIVSMEMGGDRNQLNKLLEELTFE